MTQCKLYARGGGGGGSREREVADGADAVFTDTEIKITPLVITHRTEPLNLHSYCSRPTES